MVRHLSGGACEHGPRGTGCVKCYKADHGGAHICEHLIRRRTCRTCRPLVDTSRQRLISWVQFLANGAAIQVSPQDQANSSIQLVSRAHHLWRTHQPPVCLIWRRVLSSLELLLSFDQFFIQSSLASGSIIHCTSAELVSDRKDFGHCTSIGWHAQWHGQWACY